MPRHCPAARSRGEGRPTLGGLWAVDLRGSDEIQCGLAANGEVRASARLRAPPIHNATDEVGNNDVPARCDHDHEAAAR